MRDKFVRIFVKVGIFNMLVKIRDRQLLIPECNTITC